MSENLQDNAMLDDSLEFLYCLRGEWLWKKDEPRCGYQKEFQDLEALIEKLERRLGRRR